MVILGYVLIIILLGVEVWCAYRMRQILKYRSEQRTAERRAASRPRAYRQVHKEWTIYRNRRELSNYLKR